MFGWILIEVFDILEANVESSKKQRVERE